MSGQPSGPGVPEPAARVHVGPPADPTDDEGDVRATDQLVRLPAVPALPDGQG